MKFIKRSWMSLCLGILVLFNVSCTGKKAASEDKDEVLSYSNPLSVQFGEQGFQRVNHYKVRSVHGIVSYRPFCH